MLSVQDADGTEHAASFLFLSEHVVTQCLQHSARSSSPIADVYLLGEFSSRDGDLQLPRKI